MRKWGLSILLLIILTLPLGVQAQEDISFNSVQIQIWPEYDRPGVLVIYQLELSATTPLPADISIRIPAAAGDPNAVAARQVDGSLFNIDYTRIVAGEWASINFTTTVPQFQLEYYDPQLTKDNNSRHFQYSWPGDHAISELIIQVQQPANATAMRLSPSLGAGTRGDDNLTYFSQSIGAITAGQTIRITVDYDKPDDSLSAENLTVVPSDPLPQNTVSDINISTWLPWILGIVGAGLIIGGVLWFWNSGRQRPAPQTRRSRSKAQTTKRETAAGGTETGIYCSQCGKRASPGDLFCRSCGAQIRSK